MVSTKSYGKNTMPRAEQIVGQHEALKSQRVNFESYWQTLHDFFYIEATDVNRSYFPGTELNIDKLYDSTTLEAADVLASGFMNYLTPPTSRWFSLKAKNPLIKDNKAVGRFLDDVAEEVNYVLDRSNFYNQMYTNYKSSGIYGTSTMIEEEDIEDDARFTSVPIKNVCFQEDSRGRVIAYYIDFEYTAQQAAERWGEDKLSDKMQEEMRQDIKSNKKHPFVLYISKRHVRDVRKSDKENLPIEALWVDVNAKKIMEESGYNEFPVMCHRFEKRPYIPWGFSPAMKALPFARVLNAAAKTNLRSMMKHTDPAVAIPDNAFLMPLNMNPRAINYYNKARMDGGAKDIFSFGNNGDPNAGMMAVDYYSGKVKSLMYYDVFLAFDRITKQMNNPEIMERINEKMTLLGPSVGRFISEMINPVIIRTIGILSRQGKLPQPPEEFLMAPEYEIDCISQLAQAQRRSQLQGLMTGLNIVGEMANYAPTVLDKVNQDKVVDETWSILGAPQRVLRSDEEVQVLREEKAKMAQQQAMMDQSQQGAELLEKGSKVDLNLAKAQKEGKNE